MPEYHRTMADRSPAPAALSSDAEPSRWHCPHSMQQAVPGTSTFSRHHLSTGFKHLMGDTQTTFNTLMTRWKPSSCSALSSTDLPLMRSGDCAEMPSTRTRTKTHPGKRYMLRASPYSQKVDCVCKCAKIDSSDLMPAYHNK
ncbi:hypothetical protein DER46DRAFT_641884 [Fusarium sp. MPI-SDFR-AT-0072]|nr:hypothetical protein DER46DRAFT_641884 [Fusarium sp. MPI-SDFR-AT-0072]